MRFDGKVAVITGAGGGLGRAYALLLASLGAKVVVNDLGVSTTGEGQSRAADKVVEEIKSKGGIAVANYDSVENGEKIVNTAITNFGRIDILINNAGILRDISFAKMTDKDWDLIMLVHMKGSFSCSKAAWPHMQKQNYGRIINTASAAGLYGNFGQVNYSSAKLGLLGFTKALALEGEKKNIHVNCIAPLAGTRMTETIMPKEIVDALKPEYIAPIVAYLCHEQCNDNGQIFECGAGWVAKLRWQRNEGLLFKEGFSIDDVDKQWNKVSDFTKFTYPTVAADSTVAVVTLLEENKKNKPTSTPHATSHATTSAHPNTTPLTTYTPQTVSIASAPKKTSSSNADKLFALMGAFLQHSPDAKKLTQKVNAIFHFEITPKKNEPSIGTWEIDLKNKPCVTSAPVQKPDAHFLMTESDFINVCTGKLNPQIAFMQGKMKIKGNMKAATKFTPELFPPINLDMLKLTEEEALKKYLSK